MRKRWNVLDRSTPASLIRTGCLVVSLAGQLACGSGSRKVDVHAKTADTQDGDVQAVRAVIQGRVQLDGRPVTRFGMLIVTDHRHSVDGDPILITDRDGRFSITVVPATWDIVIVGPGFGRTVLDDLTIKVGTTVLPTVVVDRDFVVSGRVVDQQGNVASNARVRIEQAKWNSDEEESIKDLARGNHITLADEHGNFEIRGFRTQSTNPRIYAVSEGGKSHHHALQDRNMNVTLVVMELGVIAGRVVGSGDLGSLMVILKSSTHAKSMFWGAVRKDGGFDIREIPIGKYEIAIMNASDDSTARVVKMIEVEPAKITRIVIQSP